MQAQNEAVQDEDMIGPCRKTDLDIAIGKFGEAVGASLKSLNCQLKQSKLKQVNNFVSGEQKGSYPGWRNELSKAATSYPMSC